MNPIDDLFRDGLGGRKDDLPKDMWQRIQAGKPTAAPEGAELDAVFSNKLKDRRAAVPAGMWARIVAARKPVALVTRTRVAIIVGLLLLGLLFFLLPFESQEIMPVAPSRSEQQEATPEEGIVADVDAKTDNNSAPRESRELTEEVALVSPADEAPAVVVSSVPTERSTENPERRAATEMATDNSSAPVNAIGETEKTSPRTSVVAQNDPTEENSSVQPEEGIAETSVPDREVTTATPGLQLSELMLLDNPTQLPRIRGNQRPQPREGGAFRASASGVQMELLFGVAYANQMFSIRNEVDRPLLDAREVSEFPETSYQVTARATWRLKERLYFMGGLSYAEVRNQLEYDQFINGVQTLVKTNNSIRLLEAPLLVGFSVPGRRMRLSLNVGPVINLTTSARGRFISPDAPGLQDLSVDADYRSNLGIGWMSSITTAYQIGKERPFTLLVEPFFKYYPGAFTMPSAALQEKYWVAGLQLGVRKSLQ